jgi:shikimate dehydrogenase
MAAMPALEIDLSGLGAGALVYDIVYAPLETPLLAAARAGGFCAIDGLGMLCHQAALAFEAWFGILPVVDSELRKILEQAINAAGKEVGQGR